MRYFNSINEILDFAIEQEQIAVDFYSDLAKNTNINDLKKTFLEFVKEEMSHKLKLQKIKKDGVFSEEGPKDILDLKISDYISGVKATPNMSYQDTLIVAMKREKAAFKLYNSLSAMAPNENLSKIFKNLAIEEANHKLQFETEYDEFILKDN